jgi:hypothetical protein
VTTISESPSLQVLAKDGSVMLANISGANNPVAILEDKVLDLLFVQCRNARAEVQKAGGNESAALELCTTLGGILELYANIRSKYYGGVGIERERAAAQHELEEAIKALEKFQPKPR